jgi:hypothetical protein
MEQQWSIDTMTSAHPVDAALLGTIGAAAAHLCEDLSNSFIGKQFEFMNLGEYQALGNAAETNRIYWREILFRIYWAAAVNIMRHQRWQAACVRAFSAPANLLGFGASLRGLLEGAEDAWYSLRPVLQSLAQNRSQIECALTGSMRDNLIPYCRSRRPPHTFCLRAEGR